MQLSLSALSSSPLKFLSRIGSLVLEPPVLYPNSCAKQVIIVLIKGFSLQEIIKSGLHVKLCHCYYFNCLSCYLYILVQQYITANFFQYFSKIKKKRTRNKSIGQIGLGRVGENLSNELPFYHPTFTMTEVVIGVNFLSLRFVPCGSQIARLTQVSQYLAKFQCVWP